MNKIFIHQPDFCPWLNFFIRVNKADYFIILDDIQFNRRGWLNKDFIKTANGVQKITVPVKKISRENSFVNSIKISYENEWTSTFLKTLQMNYSRSINYPNNIKVIENILKNKYEYLIDLNLEFIKYFFFILNIKTKIIKSSELNLLKKGSNKILEICQLLDCSEYITGEGSKNYLDLNKFKENKIDINFKIKFKKKYDQINGKFINNLSIIDYFLNCYDETKKNDILK